MFRIRPSLLARLRRHRGVWMLAMAVLLFKLVSGSVCLADAPSAALTAHASTTATTMIASTPVSADVAGEPACLLGETAGCHCTCAHAMPVPATTAKSPTGSLLAFVPPPVSSGIPPTATGSPLRPPIA